MNISLPIKLPTKMTIARKRSKDRNYYLNLNQYRNYCHYINNSLKIMFNDAVNDQLEGKEIGFPPPYKLVYVCYPSTKARIDVANYCCIVDKYFCDCVTKLKLWEDDNFHILKEINYTYGEVDKDNPRVEVFILPFKE